MDDKQLIDDILGSFTKYGVNADRSSLSVSVFVVLSDRKEFQERLDAIGKISDTTILQHDIEIALIALDG